MVEPPKRLMFIHLLQLNYNTEFFEFTDCMCQICELLDI